MTTQGPEKYHGALDDELERFGELADSPDGFRR
jgi:hypothetical protein